MKILLVGGGSGGSVAPLLAVAGELKKHHQDAEFLLLGTKSGPEELMAKRAKIAFASITAGKLRRYFSWQNFISPFLILVGFFEARKILKLYRPDCVFGTGSFVQVPAVWAAWFLNIPVVLHQQDVVPSLANRLCQFAAKKITVTFEANLPDFSSSLGIFYKKHQPDKVVLTGNPFREDLAAGSKAIAQNEFRLRTDLPTLLVLGGGTGAEFLNNLVVQSLPELNKTVQIIHSTGVGKLQAGNYENYHAYEFISDMASAYAAADIVLSRAGLSTLTELSHLKKLSIIIALPNTHQEFNARLLAKLSAAIVLNQQSLTPAGLVRLIRKLIFAGSEQTILKNNIGRIMPKDAAQKVSKIILKLVEEHGSN